MAVMLVGLLLAAPAGCSCWLLASVPRLDAFAISRSSASLVHPCRSCTPVSMADNSDDDMADNSDDDMKVTVRIKKPSPKAANPQASPHILAIEATFVQAASGMGGANYEFGLMEFIRATRDAYDEGIMVPALNLELSMCQQYTAGRPLQQDETELRTVWLSLIYLTFERVGYASKSADTFPGQSVAADLRQKFYTFTVNDSLVLAACNPSLTRAETSDPDRNQAQAQAQLNPSLTPTLTQPSMTS